MKRLVLVQFGCILTLFTVGRVTAGAEKCYLEMDEGNCSDSIQRWYFDNVTGLCQPFTYTGCGGNANNFNSTAYCYHACNVSQDGGHSYSIEDLAAKLKGRKTQGVEGGIATTPTDFEQQRQRIQTTRQPTLIRSRRASGLQENKQKRKRRSVREVRRQRKTTDQDGGYDAMSGEDYDGEAAQYNEFKAKRYLKRRRGMDQFADDHTTQFGTHYSYYGNDGLNDEVGNSFRGRGRGRGVDIVGELLSQMQHTAALLENFVMAATAHRRSMPGRRRRPTPKNADADTASKSDKAGKNVADYFRRRPITERKTVGIVSRPTEKNSRRRGERDQRLLHVTLLGRLERFPVENGERRAAKPEIRTDEKSQSDTSDQKTSVKAERDREQSAYLQQRVQSERRHEPEVDTTIDKDQDDNDDDDDIEIMSDKIMSIVADPESSFSYGNISAEDMISLEEILSQSAEYGTMKLVEKDEDEEEDKKNDGTTAATATQTGGSTSTTNRQGRDPIAEPAQQVAEVASDSADEASKPKAI